MLYFYLMLPTDYADEPKNFTFHDLRHTAINNWRLQGHDFFRIMAASGHKTMSVFKRYNTVSEEELRGLVVILQINSENLQINSENWKARHLGAEILLIHFSF